MVTVNSLALSMVVSCLSPLVQPPTDAAERRAEFERLLPQKWRQIDGLREELLPVPPEAMFVDIQHSDLPQSRDKGLFRGGLAGALRERLQWTANPHVDRLSTSDVRAAVRVFAAWKPGEADIIEYRWKYKGQTIRFLMAVNAVRFDIDLDELDTNPQFSEHGPSRVDRARVFVNEVFRLKGDIPAWSIDRNAISPPTTFEVVLPWPERLEDGVAFSSNPDMNAIVVTHWWYRVDAFVTGDTLSLMSYGKSPVTMGFVDGSKWFPDEFRAFVHEKARAQGKMPAGAGVDPE